MYYFMSSFLCSFQHNACEIHVFAHMRSCSLLLCSILFYDYTTINLCILLVMDIWVIASLGLLWI